MGAYTPTTTRSWDLARNKKSKVEFFKLYGRKQFGGLEKLDNSQVLFKTNFPPTGYLARQSAAPSLAPLEARGALNRLAGKPAPG